MNKLYSIILMSALSACASGPTMLESDAAVAAIPADMGRVVVYRNGIMGAAIQPTVSIDGVERGKCQPNGAFSVDVAPGNKTVAATTEVRRETVVTVAEGQTSYVRCSIGFGFLVGQPRLEVVTAETGQEESTSLVFLGRF
jgi:hypothetical protein